MAKKSLDIEKYINKLKKKNTLRDKKLINRLLFYQKELEKTKRSIKKHILDRVQIKKQLIFEDKSQVENLDFILSLDLKSLRRIRSIEKEFSFDIVSEIISVDNLKKDKKTLNQILSILEKNKALL